MLILWQCISYDNAYSKPFLQGEGEKNHVGTIIEFFKTTDGDNYFRGQWFYRVEDTVSKISSSLLLIFPPITNYSTVPRSTLK